MSKKRKAPSKREGSSTSQDHEVDKLEENLPSSDLPEDLVTVPVSDSEVHHEEAPKQPCPDPVSNEHVDPEHQSPRKLEQQLKESKKKIGSLKKKLKLSQQ